MLPARQVTVDDVPNAAAALSRQPIGVGHIFRAFLLIGGSSLGGGVIAHLRLSLVAKRRWLDDREFVELLSISQSLPGLNATNMATLVGDRLAGTVGAIAAVMGLCLPGGIFMYLVGVVYQAQRERPFVEAALDGVAAGAVGLILATTLQLGRSTLSRLTDLLFMLLVIVCVNRLDVAVPYALLGVGIAAAVWYGVTSAAKGGARP